MKSQHIAGCEEREEVHQAIRYFLWKLQYGGRVVRAYYDYRDELAADKAVSKSLASVTAFTLAAHAGCA